MRRDWFISPVSFADLQRLGEISGSRNFPQPGLERLQLVGWFHAGRVQGVVGYEMCHPYAVLQCLLVEAPYRQRGWQTILLDVVRCMLAEDGVVQLFALTRQGEVDLKTLGAVAIPFSELPQPIRSLPQFAEAAGREAYVLPCPPAPAHLPPPSVLRLQVQQTYAKAAQTGVSCCGSGDPQQWAEALGYAPQDVHRIPEEANLGLSCGNPLTAAQLQPKETVLDLGSGAGFDCFLAAQAVGPLGRVIGVDMTPEMVEKARFLAEKHGFSQVEFRLGAMEHLPVADATVDVVISNCAINLATDKRQVFREIQRVLKPGGRIAIADTVLMAPLPPELARSTEAYAACIAGALTPEQYQKMLEQAGFTELTMESSPFPCGGDRVPIGSVLIRARKPTHPRRCCG
ncbi:MAG: arsenite methyltransferase [Thermoanaerobaculum sp.]|nr:arsenite methyltransferase [Thermoanaerobaculum sp.]MDW7967419.1 arsenite methyltransferase [Thermoanaerobaculum sp.]